MNENEAHIPPMKDPSHTLIAEDNDIRIRKVVSNNGNKATDYQKVEDLSPHINKVGFPLSTDKSSSKIHTYKETIKNKVIENNSEKKYKKTKSGKFQCIKCDKQYASHSAFHRHYLRVHEDNLNCSHCPYVAYDEYRLKDHIRSKHSEKKFICTFCAKGFDKELSFQEHIIMVHNFSCDKCDKTFVTAAHLVKHLEVDQKSAVYNCNQCCYHTSPQSSSNLSNLPREVTYVF